MRSLDLTEHTHAPERLACDNFAPQAVIYKLNSYCRAAVVHKSINLSIKHWSSLWYAYGELLPLIPHINSVLSETYSDCGRNVTSFRSSQVTCKAEGLNETKQWQSCVVEYRCPLSPFPCSPGIHLINSEWSTQTDHRTLSTGLSPVQSVLLSTISCTTSVLHVMTCWYIYLLGHGFDISVSSDLCLLSLDLLVKLVCCKREPSF